MSQPLDRVIWVTESSNRDQGRRRQQVRSGHEYSQNSTKLNRPHLSLSVYTVGRVLIHIGARRLRNPNLLGELHQERSEHENGVCWICDAEMAVVMPTVFAEDLQDPVIRQEVHGKKCLRVVVVYGGKLNYLWSVLGF